MTQAPTAPQFELILSLGPDSGITEGACANRQLLVDAYRAMLAGDDNALTHLLDPDVEFFEAKSLPYGVEAKGIEATLQGVAAMFGPWRHLRVEIFEFAAAGDIVIAYMMLHGTPLATEEIYVGHTAEIFRFRNSKIIEWRPIYWDTHRVLEVCGLA